MREVDHIRRVTKIHAFAQSMSFREISIASNEFSRLDRCMTKTGPCHQAATKSYRRGVDRVRVSVGVPNSEWREGGMDVTGGDQ